MFVFAIPLTFSGRVNSLSSFFNCPGDKFSLVIISFLFFAIFQCAQLENIAYIAIDSFYLYLSDFSIILIFCKNTFAIVLVR